VRGKVAVVGGVHSWPLLRAYFDEIQLVPDVAAHYADALEYVEPEYGPAVLAPVQLALEGAFDRVSSVIFDRDHMMAYLYVQELHRRGLIPGLAPLYLFDTVIDDGDAVRRHGRDELDRLCAHFRRVTGREWDEERLEGEIAAERRLATALAGVQARRREGRLAGVAAKAVLAARRELPVDQTIAALDSATSTAPAGPRVMLVPTASDPGTALHELIERAGADVVAEDDWYGSRSIVPAPEGDGAILDRLHRELLATAASDRVSPMERRLGRLDDMIAAESPDVVVVLTDPDDSRRGWDVPELRRIGEARGVPVVWIHAPLGRAEDREHVFQELRREFAAQRGEE